MKSILKFEIPVYATDHGEVNLPVGAQILTVGTQVHEADGERVFLWALVDTEELSREKIALCVVGTGHPFPPDADPDRFIGTVHFTKKTLVFHIFKARDGGVPDTFDLGTFFDEKKKWSLETFGPGDRYTGVVEHIRRELDEILAKPSDLVEWVDVALLAMDGAWRSADANGARFVEALVAKQEKNRLRTWPDWRTLKPGEVSQHVETEKLPAFCVGMLVHSQKTRAPDGSFLFGRIVERDPRSTDDLNEDWFAVEHAPWLPGAPTRLLVHRSRLEALTIDFEGSK